MYNILVTRYEFGSQFILETSSPGNNWKKKIRLCQIHSTLHKIKNEYYFVASVTKDTPKAIGARSIRYTVGVLSGQRRHADVASKSVGRNPSPTSCQLAMALLCFMQVLPMRYPIYKVHVEAGCDGKPFEGTLVGITPASTLVTPLLDPWFATMMLY